MSADSNESNPTSRDEENDNPPQTEKKPPSQEKRYIIWSLSVLVLVLVAFIVALVVPKQKQTPTSPASASKSNKDSGCSIKDGFNLCFQVEGCATKECSCKAWIHVDSRNATDCKYCESCDNGFAADCTNVLFLADEGMFSCNTKAETEPPKPESETETVECNQQSDDLNTCVQFDKKCSAAGCGCALWYEYPTGEKEHCNSCEICETGFMADCSNTTIGDEHFC